MNLIYATSNPGKLAEARVILAKYNLPLLGLVDYQIKKEIAETGNTLEENAYIKARFYQQLLPNNSIVIGDDTGLEIDALNGEPGIKVRRWKGYRMQDEEIIEYCLERMKSIPLGNRRAKFRTVLAVAAPGAQVKYFEGVLHGQILKRPNNERKEGMPFWPLFYLPDLHLTLGEFHSLPIESRLNRFTHREYAFRAALPYLKSLLT